MVCENRGRRKQNTGRQNVRVKRKVVLTTHEVSMLTDRVFEKCSSQEKEDFALQQTLRLLRGLSSYEQLFSQSKGLLTSCLIWPKIFNYRQRKLTGIFIN